MSSGRKLLLNCNNSGTEKKERVSGHVFLVSTAEDTRVFIHWFKP